ncbi:MAG: hypothetical protein BWZ00_01383 [Bacteroidetes bacterium ADurb.BinA174]|jgi:hypothetical protein|nr:MAG: hypothetical protein BWZ00_01383 [Bacteroidetes bacterium ADurb.BinA174]
MPLTALQYEEELLETISQLSNYAESISISDKKDVLRFGASARIIQYKKMAIIYIVHNNRVVVRAVMPLHLSKNKDHL